VCFGVSIPSGQHRREELAAMRRGYARNVSLIGLLMGAVYVALIFIVTATVASVLLGVFLLAYLTVVYTLYLRRWRQVKELKSRLGWETEARSEAVADTRFSAGKRAVSPAWFGLHALIIIATVLAGILLYDRIPAEVVLQTDAAGNVTSVAAKSIGLIMFAPVMQAIMLLVFAFIYWSMLKTPPVLDPDNPEVSSRQNAVFRHRWSAWTIGFGALMLLTLLVVQLSITQLVQLEVVGWASMVAVGLGVVGALVITLLTGQSGSRVRLGKKADGEVIRRDDDKYWKWGAYYVNRDDPALFVEKRFGVGFTINFGRPAAILLLVGLIALIAVSIHVAPLLFQ
jgi:uncharacterized membrane protein